MPAFSTAGLMWPGCDWRYDMRETLELTKQKPGHQSSWTGRHHRAATSSASGVETGTLGPRQARVALQAWGSGALVTKVSLGVGTLHTPGSWPSGRDQGPCRPGPPRRTGPDSPQGREGPRPLLPADCSHSFRFPAALGCCESDTTRETDMRLVFQSIHCATKCLLIRTFLSTELCVKKETLITGSLRTRSRSWLSLGV